MAKIIILGKERLFYPAFIIAVMAAAGFAGENSGSRNVAQPVELPYEHILPGAVTDYEILTQSSEWSGEYILQNRRLDENGLLLEQKHGRSCFEIKPWLLVRNIDSGKGFAIFLAYSGNWRIEVKQAGENTLLRAAAVPPCLTTFDNIGGLPIPGALTAEFTGEWDNGAVAIKRFIRAKLLRDLGDDWPLVQYNTWYDKYQKLEPKRLLEIVEMAADLGCELFIIDAGWYGTSPRWELAIGDWSVNKERFPDGIEPVAKKVRQHGMKFGLWVEIECANPNSPVALEHPQWFLADANKPASLRGCLDFGKPEVLEWASKEIYRLIDTYKPDYIKMDFNTNLDIEGESCDDSPLWRHYRGLARLWRDMRQKYPNLIIENCSSGSLRADLTAAAYADTHWVSDAVGNNDNLVMNFGATYIFPPEMCNHWTCTPADSNYLDVRGCFRVNMLGQLGLSGAIIEWSDDLKERAKEEISVYKKLRPLIRKAEVFHLTSQADLKNPHSTQILQYIEPASGQSIIFVFGGGAIERKITIKPLGLKNDAFYRISGYDDFIKETIILGNDLMQGYFIELPKNNSSAIINIELSQK